MKENKSTTAQKTQKTKPKSSLQAHMQLGINV